MALTQLPSVATLATSQGMEEKAEKAKKQKQNNNLLLLACTRGYHADAQHLVQTGADIAARDKQHVSTLHFAAAHGHLDVVSYLWSKGAELDWETSDGKSPLHLAALKGHSNVVQFLLSKQAWADAQDAQDNTPLHLAARGKSTQTVSELLKVSANISITNKLALTPLAEAVVSGRVDNAQLLLKQDPKGLRHRAKGWSLLHLAASTGQAASVAMLIKLGAAVQDTADRCGVTPLHAAAISGSVACVNLLLDAKASTSAAADDGSLPADLVPAQHPDKPQLLALLKSSSSSASKQKKSIQDKAGSSNAQTQEAAGTPQVQTFKALSKREQLSRVERWAQSGPEDAQVSGELKGFWSEVKKRLAEAHKTLMVLALHKVLMMLHEDEDYQRDVGDAEAMDAVLNDVKQHPEKLQKYSMDPARQNVFKKMELFTMVLKATDQRGKVPWQETLTPPHNPKWKEQDETRKQGLVMMLETQKEAAIAAVLAGSEEDAARLADAAESASKQSLMQSQQATTAATASTSSSTSAATSSISTSRGGTVAAASNSGRTSTEPVTSSQKPVTNSQKPPSGLRSRQSQQQQQQQSNGQVSKGQSGTKPAPPNQPAVAGEDALPEAMTWKEALWHLRFQIIGYGILLLGFWVWLLYMDYVREQPGSSSSAVPDSSSEL